MTDTATYISSLGPIVIESDGKAITSLRFCREQNSATQGEYAPKATITPPIIAETIQWLDDYFAGKRPCNVPRIDPQGTAFQKRVWQALLTIPYAQTKTYGEIAKMVECRSAQAVGQAVGRASGRTSRRAQSYCPYHPLPPSHCRTWQNRRVRIRNGDKKETFGTGRKSY